MNIGILLVIIILLIMCVMQGSDLIFPLMLLILLKSLELLKYSRINKFSVARGKPIVGETVGGKPIGRKDTGGEFNDTSSTYPCNDIVQYLNPEFVTRQISTPKFNLTLIDEGNLIGGSKQRIMPMILAQIKQKNIIYAGPSTGYAQIALAYVCKMMGKNAILFLDCTKKDKAPLTDIAKKFGAVVHYFNPKIKEKRLQYTVKQATQWHKQHKDSFILPFGLNNENAIKLYSDAFQGLKKLKPKRLWVVAGSGLIFTSLSRALPNTKLMIVQVGKKIWADQLEGINHQLFISKYKFKENVKEIPPYDTLLNYDAKVWSFILKYGKEGDYVWNTASSPKPWKVYDDELIKIEQLKDKCAH